VLAKAAAKKYNLLLRNMSKSNFRSLRPMKKRQWNVRHSYVEQPDARSRWDSSYQSLIQWSKTGLKDQPLSPLLQENSHEHGDIRSGVNESDKHKPKRSNNSYISYVNTVKSEGGSGRRSISFAMMATAERAYAVLGWIVCAIWCAMPPLTAS
jgi:hypothetical protein